MKISCHFFSTPSFFFFFCRKYQSDVSSRSFLFHVSPGKASRNEQKKKGRERVLFFVSPGARERVRDTMRKLPNVAELLV